MIVYPVEREDGFYQFGDSENETLTIWAAYYMVGQTEISAPQYTNDPAYFIEGALQEGWVGVGSDSSFEELEIELNDRGITII